MVENQRRATLLTVSYHYYQNRSTVSQSRSFTLNSYKPEKMANQCVDAITKSTQCPVAFVGISASKFVPSKESGTFLKFFKTVKAESNDKTNRKADRSVAVNSSEGTSKFKADCEAEGKKSSIIIDLETIITDKEARPLKEGEKEESLAIAANGNAQIENVESVAIEESITMTNSETATTGNKRIVDVSLTRNSEDSPTSRKVFKLMQVCNKRDEVESKSKRMSNVDINNKDFQSSFFMNVYKTGRNNRSDETHGIDRSIDTAEKSAHAERSTVVSSVKDLDADEAVTDDHSSDSCMRENSHVEIPSTSRAHTRTCSNNVSPVKERNEEISTAQNSTVRLREIFPNVDDIDPDILLLLPADLQEEARLYAKSREKKRENAFVTRNLPTKATKGKSGQRSKVAGKSKRCGPLLYNFLIKTDSHDHDVPLKRCAECDQMISVTRYDEHADFHVAQNLCREINKPTAGENGVKRKLENGEIVAMSAKRQANICELDGDS